MTLSRRTLLRATAAAAGAATLSSHAAVGRAGDWLLRADATTTGRTLVRGTPGPGGYTPLIDGPPSARVVRTDLGIEAAAGRTTCRRPLLAFAHLSDIHCLDHQSPLRVEWLDRFEDPSELGDIAPGLFTSSHRPQEIFANQVSDAMVRAINQIAVGPVTGIPLGFAIETGDNSDNAQFNEIRWNIDLLDGGPIVPDSGSTARYEGVMGSSGVDDALYYDPHYWHPDGTPLLAPDDHPRRQHGFPEIPGVLDAARRPFEAGGLDLDWYSVFGNHDGLVQGTLPNNAVFATIATGPAKIISLPVGLSQADVIDAVINRELGPLLGALIGLPSARLVTPDADRRVLSRAQVVEEHFVTTGTPVGHGFTAENRSAGTAYYFFDRGDVRCIAMDSCNQNGYSNGSLDAAQWDWVKARIAEVPDKAVLVFSHHTSGTMDNPLLVLAGEVTPRVLGEEMVEHFLSQPQVVGWVNGHTHTHQVWAHTRGDGTGGFWEINTAAHIDFPQQARLIEVADNTDGTLSIFTTVIDHAAPASYGGDLETPSGLASLAREIAANDWQKRTSGYEGVPEDRNVELLVAKPPQMARSPRCDAGHQGATGGGGASSHPDGAGVRVDPVSVEPVASVAPSGVEAPVVREPDPSAFAVAASAGPGSFLPETGGPAAALLGAAGAAIVGGEAVRRRGRARAEAASARPGEERPAVPGDR